MQDDCHCRRLQIVNRARSAALGAAPSSLEVLQHAISDHKARRPPCPAALHMPAPAALESGCAGAAAAAHCCLVLPCHARPLLLQASLSEADTDTLRHQLWDHKRGLQEQQREASMELLLHFLQSSRWAWLQAAGLLVPLVAAPASLPAARALCILCID